MIICGIDPGLSGALFLLDPDTGRGAAFDMPVHLLKSGRKLDVHQLVALIDFELEHSPIAHAFLEDVHSMPKQGVAGVFVFGECKGAIKGILAARNIPMSLISPRRWKQQMQVPAAKDGARARASQLLPKAAHYWPLVKHHGRAEAALIALYGSRLLDDEASV